MFKIPKPPIDPDRRRQLQGYSLGTEFAFSIIGAAAFGALLDWWLASSPVALLIMLGAGFIGGGYNFLRRAMALNKQGAAAYKAAHPGGLKTTGKPGNPPGAAHHGPMPAAPPATRQNTPAGMFASEPVDIDENEASGFELPPQIGDLIGEFPPEDPIEGGKPKERD